MNNIVTAAQLRGAAAAVEQIDAAGRKVLAFYSNGRKPVLLVDAPPAFVHGCLRRREPDGKGGINRVVAAPYHGVQIEWRTHEQSMSEVARG